ncbi:MAG: cysteine dioxygenase family protein [Pseudomonadota bacterium]
MYSIEAFVEDTLRIMRESDDEDVILPQVLPLAMKAAAEKAFRQPDMLIADPELGFGSTLLHEEDDKSLFVVVDSWLPGRGVRPHDHGTWAVVVSMTGPEHNVLWRRIDDGSIDGHAKLEPTRETVVNIGEAIAMRTGEIHSVENRSSETTLSFHVYGKHLNHTGRSQFDTESNREIPFIIETR